MSLNNWSTIVSFILDFIYILLLASDFMKPCVKDNFAHIATSSCE